MNIEEIKNAGIRLSLEAAVGEQLRQVETAYKSGRYAAAWQNADNVVQLLRELVDITPHEKAKADKVTTISIDDLDERIDNAS